MGNVKCSRCGMNLSNQQLALSIDLSSCGETCTSPAIPDSQGRCISAPWKTTAFEIVEERSWNISDQLAKGVEVQHHHILNSTACESGFNLIIDEHGLQKCGKCSKKRFYDSSSKSCVKCSNYCEECESTTTCAACKQGTFKNQNGKCRYTCDAGYYKDNDGNCAECHADCGSIAGACSGPYPDDCTMCEFNKTSNQFKKYLIENTGKCVLPENCPPASFPSPNGKCTPCASG